ncbi:MAG: TIGR02391 family protein [Candidatus Gracilibacteria bacterium]|nr:TIGR02391 family protein [Candidatus Gracilibacteria bacterium]
MDKTQNHWIALYLSGQYPGFYTLPDRLNFFDELKDKDHNYNDVILGQFQNKSDIEFFYGLLNLFQKKHLDEDYNQLLIDLGIPEKVKFNPKDEKKEESKIEKKDDNFSEIIYKEIGNTLDGEIKKYFFNGLKTKDYGVYLREILNYLSIYLKDYHNRIGLVGEKKEGEAVEAIFKNPDLKITGVNLTTSDGESKKEGLYKLLLGTFKNYRNILAHNKSDDLKITLGEYLETFLFVNQLIKEVKEKFPLK